MGCAGSKTEFDYNELHVDNVQPNEMEKDNAEAVAALMAHTDDILTRLSHYKGCAEYIKSVVLSRCLLSPHPLQGFALKVAVRSPSLENDLNAWNAVVPAVCMLKDFFDFYDQFQKTLMKLIAFICADDPFNSLPENLMTAKMIVNMFDFVIRFDELKMGKASIQNDFSFYKRSMNRMKRGGVRLADDVQQGAQKAPVNDEVANKMSLFFAYPNPFTKALIDEFGKASEAQLGPRAHLTRCFALIANGCKAMSERSDDKGKNFGLFRAMVAAILFYDYTHAAGVFVKKSEVDVVGCVMALRRYEGESVDLINTIRYGTHTYNSDTTPRKVIDVMSL